MQQRTNLHGIKLIIRGDKHYDTIPVFDVAEEYLLKNIGIKGINLYPTKNITQKEEYVPTENLVILCRYHD